MNINPIKELIGWAAILVFLMLMMGCAGKVIYTKVAITYMNGDKDTLSIEYYEQNPPYLDGGCLKYPYHSIRCGVREFHIIN